MMCNVLHQNELNFVNHKQLTKLLLQIKIKHRRLPSCCGCQKRKRVEFDFAPTGSRTE